MNQRWFDFLSSFGMMMLGTSLLFVGSVFFTARPVESLVNKLPVSQLRSLAVGGDEIPQVLPVSKPVVPLNKDRSAFEPNLSAMAALVMDDQSNTVLFRKNGDEVRPLASITKLMSALVLNDVKLAWASTTIVLDSDLDDSSHQLKEGEKFTLDELWHVALIGSSNSAIKALVRMSGLSEEVFIERMNRKAEQLHLTSMHFTEPTGLDSGNVGSAFDTARLLKEALKVDRIARTLQTEEYYVQPQNNKKKRRIWSTNWLLTKWISSSFNRDSIVGKTGFINDSGYNFAVRIAGDNNHSLRIVVLGTGSNELRFSEARDLADWAFAHYLWPEDPGYDDLVEK